MQIQRIFVAPESIDTTSGEVTIDDAQHAHQLINVLRLRTGDTLHVLDGQGLLYVCTIADVGSKKHACRLQIKSSSNVMKAEPRVDLTVALSLLKPTRFEWAIEKLTEIGANQIVPLQTERTVVKISESEMQTTRGGKLARWNSIARESSEQCERAVIPNVVFPLQLESFLQQHAQRLGSKLLICDERREAIDLSELLARSATISGEASLVVLIGPEGGFTENEFALASSCGAISVSLGKRILRAETAAVYATSIIMSLLDKPMPPK